MTAMIPRFMVKTAVSQTRLKPFTQLRQAGHGFDGQVVRFSFSVRPGDGFAVEPSGVHAGLLGALGV